MDTREIFAMRVIELRTKQGINQAQLASMVGVSKTSANLYESANRVPDIQVLARYAKVLGVSTDYLLGLSENKTIEGEDIDKEYGIFEETANNLRIFNRICLCQSKLYFDKLPEDSLKYLQEVAAQGTYGETPEDVVRYFRHFRVIVNAVISDAKLLNLFGEYFENALLSVCIDNDDDQKRAREGQAAMDFIRLQAHILDLYKDYKDIIQKRHDFWKRVNAGEINISKILEEFAKQEETNAKENKRQE